ncbi:hypothetical protein U1Q18_028899 [Sarracenia purpurea var. burkii]
MALRAARQYWRSMVIRNGMMGGNRSSFASSTTPKMKLFTPTATKDSVHSHHPSKFSTAAAIKGDFVPIALLLGFLVVAMSIGVHTAKQQLFHNPGVQVKKKRRESMLEVDDPYYVVSDSNNFINKSFLRKVGHIQDKRNRTLPDPVRPNPYTRYVILLHRICMLNHPGPGPGPGHMSCLVPADYFHS